MQRLILFVFALITGWVFSTQAHTYAENRLVEVGLTNGNGTELQTYSYDLSPTGMRTNVFESVGASIVRQIRYGYDSINPLHPKPRVNRLTVEDYYNYENVWQGEIEYGYDAAGNRTGRTVDIWEFTPYDSLTNQSFAFDHRDLIDSDSVPNNANPNYDANGNTLVDNGTNTGDLYDAENRLISTGSGVTMTYDADGNRVSKNKWGTTTYYLVDDLNPTGYSQVLAEYGSLSGTPNMTYTWGLALINRNSYSANPAYYGYDGQGNVRMLVDNFAPSNIIASYDYDGFGDLLASSESYFNAYRYAGQQWDPDLGMYYNRARYYKPSLGRFWTMDTFGGNQEDPLSLHKYLYCQANPVNMIDPSGCDGELADVLTAIYNGVSIASRTAFSTYEAYNTVERTVDAVELAATAATGGSVSMAQVGILAVQFVPFGSLLGKIGIVGKIGEDAQSLLKQIYKLGGGKLVGETGALMACTAQGLKSIGFKAAAHGFDDVVEDAAGNLIVVEAKGGAGALYRNQMSRAWIEDNITKLKNTGQAALADRLEMAVADGKLKGMVVSTAVKGADAFNPVAELKNWAQIGATKW